MESHADSTNRVADASSSHASAPVKRKIMRRAPTEGSELSPSPARAAASTAGATATQIVNSEDECNALVARIRQLESESSTLSKTLTRVCDENSRLTEQISALESKIRMLAQEPLKQTSVLHSLFEPEKTGWFGGSKSAAQSQLQQLSDALQSEFISYKASHMSSNEEVQALVEGLHNAHLSAQELSKVVKEQQELISGGSLAVSVQIVPIQESANGGATLMELEKQLREIRDEAELSERQLHSSQAEMKATKAENARLRSELAATSAHAAAAAAGAPPLPRSAASPSEDAVTQTGDITAERDDLRLALEEARRCIAENEGDLELLNGKVAQLQLTLAKTESKYMEEVNELQQQLTEAPSTFMACAPCYALRRELEEVVGDARTSGITVPELCRNILEMLLQHESNCSTLDEKVPREHQQLDRSVSTDDYDHLRAEQELLMREIHMHKQHIAVLEANHNATTGAADAKGLSDVQVMETLHKIKKYVAKLEAERGELLAKLQQAHGSAAARDAELQGLRARSEEDKQRVSFLLKKCSAATADARGMTAQLEALEERVEKQSLELKQERRKTEKMAELQRHLDGMAREKKILEERLAGTESVEERLVKAKETIAFMELAQSSTINMSQFAELKAEKERLQNTQKPLERKLEEAKQEIERLKAVTDAQQAISSTQNDNVRTWQEQVTALSESEAKLRDKVSILSSENARLTKVNQSLEQQMSDMQDGIKAMAEHMERDRSTAKATAEANSQKQIQTLSDELAQARATISEVQTRDGQYVAEGLYQSVVAERERALEENRKTTAELEKRRSEISIYRQTIVDLEQENEERVREIEALQDRYQRDRASLSERLAKEQARTAQLSSDMESVREQVATMEAAAAKQAATIEELEERNGRQKRVFEDKCRREEALSDEIKRLNGQISVLQANVDSAAVHLPDSRENNASGTTAVRAAPAPVSAFGLEAPAFVPKASTAAESDPEVEVKEGAVSASVPGCSADAAVPHISPALDASYIDVFRRRIEDLQRDNAHLTDELKHMQRRHATDSADNQRTITNLQTQIKNRMSTNDRTAYEAEIAKSAALRKSVEALMEENTTLRRQAGVRQASVTSTPPSASPAAMVEAQQMDVLQLQSQLQTQKAAFESAVKSAAKAAETYEARLRELEAQLCETEEALAAAVGAGGGDTAEDGDPSPLGKPAKRKGKKLKKKKTLMEQVDAIDDGGDIFAAVPSVDAYTGAAATQNSADATQMQTSLMLAQREVAQLKAENIQLKASITDLEARLQWAEENLQATKEMLRTAQAALEEDHHDLQKKIDELQLRPRQGDDSFSPNGTGGAVASRRSLRNASVADMEMQMRECQDEMKRLAAENKNLRRQLEKEKALQASLTPGGATADLKARGGGSDDVQKLQLQLRRKDAEIKALADELMPAKEKLVEYMAMTDRLGLQYPFPRELEETTVLRLKALHLPAHLRAASAPAVADQQTRKTRVDGNGNSVSPPPRAPNARRALN